MGENKKIAKFIYDRYEEYKEKVDIKDVEKFVEWWKDKIVCVYSNGELSGIGIYIMISDEAVKNIQDKKYNLSNVWDLAEVVFNKKGRNLFGIGAVTDGGLKVIRKGMREVIERENPKTISWIRPDMEGFVFFVKGGGK